MKLATTKLLLPSLFASALCCGCATEPASPAPAPAVKPSAAASETSTAIVASAATADRLPPNAAIETYLKSMRQDLSCGKVGIITDVMHLNSEEASVFWPIYQEYEKELFELGDLRVDAIRRFAAAQRGGGLDAAAATKLSETYFDFEAKRLQLLKDYNGLIAERLSPVRAAQFTQIEHRVSTVIDLVIASELPLVKNASPAGQ